MQQFLWFFQWESKKGEEASESNAFDNLCSDICQNLVEVSLGHLMGAVRYVTDQKVKKWFISKGMIERNDYFNFIQQKIKKAICSVEPVQQYWNVANWSSG